MRFPESIPIERIEDYHTHYVGTTEQGLQFWGYITFVWTVLPKDIQGDWKDYRNEYAVLHIFDNEGNHLETRHWLAGTTNQVSDSTLDGHLESMIAALQPVLYRDIQVKLFQTIIDGAIFGLVPEEEYGFIELQPNSTIAFSAPWDGSYST
jgi:formate hydrogenlyase regulatory protein HycA